MLDYNYSNLGIEKRNQKYADQRRRANNSLRSVPSVIDHKTKNKCSLNL